MAILLVTNNPTAAVAEFDHVVLQQTTQQLLLKYIDLNRFVLRYGIDADKQPKTRIWRYPLSQEAPSSCGLASSIINTYQLGSNMTHPQNISQNALRAGVITTLTGTSIGCAGSSIELAEVIKRVIINKKHNYDPVGAERYFLSQLKEIDALIDKRNVLAQAYPDQEIGHALLLENKILHDLRNYQITEFLFFHQYVTGYLTYEGAYYFLDVITRLLSISSSIYALEAFGKSGKVGTGSIYYTLAGATTMIAPLAATLLGSLTKKHYRKRFLHALGKQETIDAKDLDNDIQEWQRLTEPLKNKSEAISKRVETRLELYLKERGSFENEISTALTTTNKRSKVAIQSNIFGPLIGGLILSQGILTTTGYYRYRNSGTLTPIKLGYSSAVIGIPRSSLSISVTAFNLIQSLRYRHQLIKTGKLPRMLVEKRLAQLDEAEKEIRQMYQ